MRVATLDIGTNTVLLLVAEQHADGHLVAVTERATVTRLGQGVDRTRRFSPEALARTKTCLHEYAKVASSLRAERVAVVGTSAMRDALGGEELAAYVEGVFGVAARIVTGAEEARLTFRGALGGMGGLAYPDSDVAVFDIGGGSTEVAIGRLDSERRFLGYSESFDVGSVRLTERYVAHDPPTPSECEELRRVARATFAPIPPLPNMRSPMGLAGTMTTLAAVSLSLETYDGARVHGHVMGRNALRSVVDGLARAKLDDRRRVAGMEPRRADVIVAGGYIAEGLLDHWTADDVIISDRGVRWGLAMELIEGSVQRG